MNNYHDLYGAFLDRKLRVDPRVADTKDVGRMLATYGKSAICFEGGEVMSVLETFTRVPELQRLPYPVCWFEFFAESDRRTIFATLCVERWDGISGAPQEFSAACFTRAQGLWFYNGIYLSPAIGSPENRQGLVASTERVSFEHPGHFAEWNMPTNRFLSAVNCSNVRTTETRPDAQLQLRRVKRGRVPIFSTWTLELDLQKHERRPRSGGTHASPRVHLRRGHPREHAPGKWTWVQPHAVGNKKLGMVHKDYALAPNPRAEPPQVPA